MLTIQLKFYRKAVKVETDEEIVEESDCPKGAALSCDSEALLRSPYSPSGILRQALPLAKPRLAQIATQDFYRKAVYRRQNL